MPLHAEAEAKGRRLDALDHPVRRARVDDHAGRLVLRRLMVRRIDRQLVRADDRMQLGARHHADRMPGLVARVGLLVRQRLYHRIGNVLDQFSAQHDMQQLLPAADAQHRHVALQRPLRDGELERRAPVLGHHRAVLRAAVVVGRIDVEGPACHHQPVDARQIVFRLVGIVRQGDGQAAGRAHRRKIVLARRIPGKLGIAAGFFRVQGHPDQRSSRTVFHAPQSTPAQWQKRGGGDVPSVHGEREWSKPAFTPSPRKQGEGKDARRPKFPLPAQRGEAKYGPL